MASVAPLARARPRLTAQAWVSPLGVAALSALLGATTLASKSLWYDEAFNANSVASSWSRLVEIIRGTDMSQAAYLVLLKAWTGIGGSSEVALRIPSVVAAAVAALLLVGLGARLFDRRTGILAGVLLATNDYVVQWAQQARTYTLLVLVVVAATWLFVRAVENDTWWTWILYGVVAGASLYAHFYAGFVIASHALCVPFLVRRPATSRLLVSGCLVAVIAVPALYFTATAPRIGVEWIDPPSVGTVWTTVARNAGHNPALVALAVAGVVLLWLRPPARDGRWPAVLLFGWAVLPVALGLACSLIQPILVPRYALVIAPALALLAARGIVVLASRLPKTVAAAGVLLFLTSAYWIVHWYERTPEDWRGAASYVELHARSSDAVVLAPPWPIVAFRYYAPERPLAPTASATRALVVIRLDRDQRPEDVTPRFVDEARMNRVGRVWFGERLAVETWIPSS